MVYMLPRAAAQVRAAGEAPVGVGSTPLTLLDREVVQIALARVDLARTDDLLLGVPDHLLPLGDPAAGAPDREHHREHRDGEAQGLVDESRVEIDVRVEL